MDRIPQIQVSGQFRQIVRVVIHVMPVGSLRRAAVTPAIMGDDPIALAQEENQLRVPVVRGQRPAMGEDDGLTTAPILVIQ
jgi:hypothetical protein